MPNVIIMARIPPSTTRSVATHLFAPPMYAESVPVTMSAIRTEANVAITLYFVGAMSIASTGMMAPNINDTPDANAA